jgi:CheY-like chemotaxis protein
VLQQSGYEKIIQLIDIAYNGKEAVDFVKRAYKEKKHSYGLIFMDCSMPIMDGYIASKKIR